VSAIAIEINDAGLVVADASRVLAIDPGYALAERKGIVTGEAARRQARLQPRRVSNRYWTNLSAESGSSGLDGVDSAAELAYTQLDALWQRFSGQTKDVALVVPGHYDATQLGLLLGLAQECGIPVRVMVNAAAAASDRAYPGRQLVYVDAGLHRVSVSALEQQDGVTVRAEQGLEGVGLAQLTDTWARRVAELFVLATRFDPFHHAESEQHLYDRLPEWLAAVEREGQAELALPHGGEEIRIQVDRTQLLGAAAGFYRSLVQLIAQHREGDAALVVQLSDRLAALSGVVGELERLDDAHVVALEPGQAARGALAGLAALGGANGQVRLLRQLSWRLPPAEPETVFRSAKPAASAAVPLATHVVHRGVAYPVAAGAGLSIGRVAIEGRRTIVLGDELGGVSRTHCELAIRNRELKLTDLSRHGTFVNERRVAGEIALAPGDVIRVGSPGEELTAIRLEHDDGA
jgi:hypothetical protein